MINKLSVILILLLASSSCGLLNGKLSKTQAPGVEHQIDFINLQAIRTNNQVQIKRLNTQSASGSVKTLLKTPNSFHHPVSVNLLDHRRRDLGQIWIEHPLVQVLEYPDQDGGLQKIIQILDSADFFVRINKTPDLGFLVFKSLDSIQPIINTQIKLTK